MKTRLSYSTATMLLFLLLSSFGLSHGTDTDDNLSENMNPKYVLSLSMNEFSILHNSILSGVTKYGGDADFDVHMAMESANVVYTVTIENPKLIEIMGYWASEQSADLLNSVDFDNLDNATKRTLAATKSLNQKIKHAQDNPTWDVQTLRAIVLEESGLLFLVGVDTKYEATGGYLTELRDRVGSSVLARGVVKTAGEFEVRGFLDIKENTLELFVMSQCPFGTRAEATVLDYLDGTSKETAPILEIRYIFYKNEDGLKESFTSMHGEAEMQEDLVQIVIRDNYSNYFFRYLRARIADPASEWKDLAEAIGLDDRNIRHIEESIVSERSRLIKNEYNYVTGTYQIFDGSPTFVWECEKVSNLKQVDKFRKLDLSKDNCANTN